MPSIAIIGAGPAGLTLARLLQIASIPDLHLTIYEKDGSRASRKFQGGTLDLHPPTGQAAIRKADLWEQFSKHARYEGEELIIADKNATVYLHVKESPKMSEVAEKPEIDRELLKNILLDSIDAKNLKWGKGLKTVDEQSGILKFADGTEEGPFDLVVGAEGAWSKIRNILTETKPSYSGTSVFEAEVTKESAAAEWETVSKLSGRGSYFTFTDGKSLISQRMGDGSLKVYVYAERDQDWPAKLTEEAGGNEEKLKQKILEEFPDWNDSLKAWMRLGKQIRGWPLFELPVGHQWEHKKGWTLIGDAAHLMTPYAGLGVNAAMRDSLDLAELLISALKDGSMDLDQAVKQYEEKMYPRAEESQSFTMSNKILIFRNDAPVGFVLKYTDIIAEGNGYDLDKGWLYWVPVRKLLFWYFWCISRFGGFRRTLPETLFGQWHRK